MTKNKNHITVFEHQVAKVNENIDGFFLNEIVFEQLKKYFGKGVPYFSLINGGVRFNEYVGVIQIGNTVIEVLPKADKNYQNAKEEGKWRDLLIGMLKVVIGFEVKNTSFAQLKTKPNTILDLYFELFLTELEYLLHQGLLKKYRRKEGNSNALKGCLQFSKNIRRNLIHQERFYVRINTYDVQHQLHFILYKTILLLQKININASLQSRIVALLQSFPEMPDIKVTEKTFDKIIYNRKTLSYKRAIEISKMILLQYHPDLSKGRNNVLALMFDMNILWEKFVFVSLRKNKKSDSQIRMQIPKDFWLNQFGKAVSMRADIWLTVNNENIILDTKWKNLNDSNPSSDDLQQLFVYNEYYDAKKTALVYPGKKTIESNGLYLPTSRYNGNDRECKIIFLSIPEEEEIKYNIIRAWQISIKKGIEKYFNIVI